MYEIISHKLSHLLPHISLIKTRRTNLPLRVGLPMDHLHAPQEIKRRLPPRRLVHHRSGPTPTAATGGPIRLAPLVFLCLPFFLQRGEVDGQELQLLLQPLDPLEEHHLARLLLEELPQP